MPQRRILRTHRPAAWATLLLALACSRAFADGAPVPDADTTFDFIRSVTVGRSDGDTCPPRVCPDQPVLVTVRGQFPNRCYTLRSLRQLPVLGPLDVVAADIVVDTCAHVCGLEPVGFIAQ